MELHGTRKKLEDVAHAAQELKNSYLRLDENAKQEFKIGYHMEVEVDELARRLFEWSETQLERKHGEE
ncbi:hypothetical protein [Alkalicoccus chagannorensis]|uniref:hypothetical protein n=1 Tax=Alkalicoccus chagannorensis TaxID=427072 RepID=UPI0004257743|nr:hypothetical protein [Alkalicoccus chagannorensis]